MCLWFGLGTEKPPGLQSRHFKLYHKLTRFILGVKLTKPSAETHGTIARVGQGGFHQSMIKCKKRKLYYDPNAYI